MNVAELKTSLCESLCQEVSVIEQAQSYAVSLPLAGRDGDFFTVYISPVKAGWRVSDMGATLMRLSYENDLGKLLSGARERLFNIVLMESGVHEDDGELFLEVPANALPYGLFTLGQGMTRVECLGLWTRNRVESSFYDDLELIIRATVPVPGENVIENYSVPEIANGQDYPIDFFIKTRSRPLYLFGVNNRDKARLTTIVLQHLVQCRHNFDSMVVYSNVDEIPQPDAKRLMNAANDTVASIGDVDVIKQKITHRLAA